MAKRTKGGFEQIAAMPWWIGILIGLIGYVVIRHGIGWYFTSSHSPVLSGMGRMLANGAYAPFAWIFLIGCWLAPSPPSSVVAAAANYSTARPASTACAI